MTGWCRLYEERCETWERLGGVPDDHGTRDVACRILLALWSRYRHLEDTLTELVEAQP